MGRIARSDRTSTRRSRVAYLFVLPALLVYVAFAFLPLVHTAWLSFFEWDGITRGEWVGLDNYRALVADGILRTGLQHSLVLLVFYSLLPVSIGLLLAGFLSRPGLRGRSAFRAALFVPQTIAVVAAAVIWRFIYAPDGDLNRGLSVLGLGGLTRNWLGDFTFALPAVGLIATWIMFGFPMVLFVAGIQKISPSLYDAARVDGCGPVREFFTVTVPELRNEIIVAVGFTGILGLRAFDLVYVSTFGGPGNETVVPSFTLFQRAFVFGQVGSAAALAIVMTAFIALFVLILLAFGERSDDR